MFLVTVALLVQTAVLSLSAKLELSVTLLDWGSSQLFQYKPPEAEGRSGQLKLVRSSQSTGILQGFKEQPGVYLIQEIDKARSELLDSSRYLSCHLWCLSHCKDRARAFQEKTNFLISLLKREVLF